ncbi:hypothetical protein RFI_34674, partial [Reticulomyxa filosa]
VTFDIANRHEDFDFVRINWRTSIINSSRDFKIDFDAHPELIKESNIPYCKKIHDLLSKNCDNKTNEANTIDSCVRTLGGYSTKKKFQLLQKYREEMGLQFDEKNCVICYECIARLPIFKARELVKFGFGHHFHIGCATTLVHAAVNGNAVCPLCRSSISIRCGCRDPTCTHFILYYQEKKAKLAKKCQID